MKQNIYLNWDDVCDLVAITYKDQMNFNHAALSCELADSCTDYDDYI